MLKLRDLTFLRGEEPILERVSLSLEPGQVLVVRGSNGCGKTTLLKLLAGLLRSEDGAVVHFEQAEQDLASPLFRQELMYIGHQLGLKLDLSSLENQRFFGDFLGDAHMTPEETLRAVGLAGFDHTLALRLSAGQKKRLALARLLLNRRRLWLLDEPYSNLDGDGLALVDRLLTEHADGGGAAVITSHGTFEPRGPDVRELVL